MHARIFSDRATLSGHDNPVLINLAYEKKCNSPQMLSGDEHYNGFEEQESHNK